ncbi:MAG: hypothetical protein ACLTZM_08345 [Ruminococcus sp.]
MPKENRNAQLERISRQNKEKCAAFIVKMIEKYGKEVLEEIQKEEKNMKQTAKRRPQYK